MADWKQITARIRRARTGKDPATQLTNLFTKTRDAMVAFELARYLESVSKPDEAGRWYMTAAERFRRADWKTKAQEAATRLGATAPAEIPAPTEKARELEVSEENQTVEAEPPAAEQEKEAQPVAASPERTSDRRSAHSGQRERHGRGRRGQDSHRSGRRGEHGQQRDGRRVSTPTSAPPVEETPRELEQPSRTSREEASDVSTPTLRGRYGDPGLSSRLTQMEMNFRRLLACSPAKLEDADRAPAGPGVWVLTDSDLTTYYYVEACQTLRVASPNLVRGGGARRGGGESLKPKLAEHLGIAENRVSKYLADHCVVRWLQMDDDASYFAHFLIAVLHPALNE